MKAKGQQWQGGPTWIQEETPEEEEEKRPVTYHAGNLPKDLMAGGRASWFQDLDKDNDAQIGLYEWKDSGRWSLRPTGRFMCRHALTAAARWRTGIMSSGSGRRV